MRCIEEIKTTTYIVEEFPGFRLDMQEVDGLYEMWLYHEGYGVKMLMFGVFFPEVENLPDLEPYIELYKERYMEE